MFPVFSIHILKKNIFFLGGGGGIILEINNSTNARVDHDTISLSLPVQPETALLLVNHHPILSQQFYTEQDKLVKSC